MKDRTESIYNYIKAEQKAITVAPVIRDIAVGVGLSGQSIATVHWHITKLISRGRLKKHTEGRRVWYEFPEDRAQ